MPETHRIRVDLANVEPVKAIADAAVGLVELLDGHAVTGEELDEDTANARSVLELATFEFSVADRMRLEEHAAVIRNAGIVR